MKFKSREPVARESRTTDTDADLLANRIESLIEEARQRIVMQINYTMVQTYFEIGRAIVENEQEGESRAVYGRGLLKGLSHRLTARFGKGFSVDNLERMRKFYLVYGVKDLSNGLRKLDGEKSANVLRKLDGEKSATEYRISLDTSPDASNGFVLGWSHYLFLMGIDNPDERRFYEVEAAQNHWTVKEMKRQFDSALYERLALSRDKESVVEMARLGLIVEKPKDIVKDPYVLEFLGLPEDNRYSETTLEQRIIDRLQMFLLEMGKGYTFVGRQVRLTLSEKHYYCDLVFFNRLLQCFVLIDLKIGEITHQDLGQMQMYVHYYDREVKLPNENPTLGIVLCKKKDDMMVELTLPEDNTQIFASKYMTVLPKKEELVRLMEDRAADELRGDSHK